MLVVIGDLVEDIVVWPTGPIRHGTDTPSRVDRRIGGSGTNVGLSALARGAQVRLVSQAGDDELGRSLISRLQAYGMDTSVVKVGGETGTIVILLDEDGERSMLNDRRSSLGLDEPSPDWLAGARCLHVPLYSLAGGLMAETSQKLISMARDAGVGVTVDLSSVTFLEQLGRERVAELLTHANPVVVFANEDEATFADLVPSGSMVVAKHGGHPTVVTFGDESWVVPTTPLTLADTTGAGDAFAGGFIAAGLVHDDPVTWWHANPVAAVAAGHRQAIMVLTSRNPLTSR